MRRIAVLLSIATLAAQEEGTVKFSSSSQLVVETVTVKDKNGATIEGLTAQDFSITEDGKPQTISFCEFQKLNEAPIQQSSVPPRIDPAARAQISPEPAGDVRYRDRRLLALYFDMTAMP